MDREAIKGERPKTDKECVGFGHGGSDRLSKWL